MEEALGRCKMDLGDGILYSSIWEAMQHRNLGCNWEASGRRRLGGRILKALVKNVGGIGKMKNESHRQGIRGVTWGFQGGIWDCVNHGKFQWSRHIWGKRGNRKAAGMHQRKHNIRGICCWERSRASIFLYMLLASAVGKGRRKVWFFILVQHWNLLLRNAAIAI